jgi:hypothetical protein
VSTAGALVLTTAHASLDHLEQHAARTEPATEPRTR